MWLTCPECREETDFEQPPCSDGHGIDCPERFCTTCGLAVFVGGAQLGLLAVAGSAAPAAPQRSTHPHAA